MAKRYGLSALLLSLCFILCVSPAWAHWAKNGVLVSGESYDQYDQKIISDGVRGAVIVWIDYRNGADADIYGNRIDGDGNVLGGSGVPVCVTSGEQVEPQLIPDGAAGGIIVWRDLRAGNGYSDIYAQRVDGTGTAHWAENGIPICTADYNQDGVRIVPDGADGAIIVWADARLGQYDIYAQRVTGDGDTLWAANGIPVDTSIGDQWSLEMVPDGSGGAIIVWYDTRNGSQDLYAQRIDGNGNLPWGPDAVPVCVGIGYEYGMRLAAASGGGAFLAWVDDRNGDADVFVQKIGQDGSILWQSNGMFLCSYGTAEYSPQVADDGSGGAIFAWYDQRSGMPQVFAQRVDADGNLAWSPYGVMVFSSYGNCDLRIMADGSGGIIAVLDIYYDTNAPTDIYAQRLDHDGNVLWGSKGAAICLAQDGQYCPTLAPDERGGAIVSWYDYRAETGFADIYCQRVGASGLWGSAEPTIVSCFDVPNDQGGWVRLRSRASSHDVTGENDTAIFGYNVWREIPGGGGPFAASAKAAKASAKLAAGMSAADRSKLVTRLSDPATAKGVRVSASQARTLGLPPGDWESVGFWFATRDTMYNIAVPTKNDSTEAGTPRETFIVTAHTTIAGVFAASAPDSGYSVDNLAPGATGGFAGVQSLAPPGLRLTWTQNDAPDLWKYNVHRGDDPSFVPDGSNLVGTTTETTLIDADWVPSDRYFYKLLAIDRHGNASPEALLTPDNIKVGTALQGFTASLVDSWIEISWTLSGGSPDMKFSVLRADASGGTFEEVSSAEITSEGRTFTCKDRSCEPGSSYKYRVDVLDGSGRWTLFETASVSTPALPLTLYQNHPNPFNPSTAIEYYMPSDGQVTLYVYDSSGRLVTRLLDGGKQAKGTHTVEWHGIDAQGRAVSSGVYFYRLQSGKETISKKMVLLR